MQISLTFEITFSIKIIITKNNLVAASWFIIVQIPLCDTFFLISAPWYFKIKNDLYHPQFLLKNGFMVVISTT